MLDRLEKEHAELLDEAGRLRAEAGMAAFKMQQTEERSAQEVAKAKADAAKVLAEAEATSGVDAEELAKLKEQAEKMQKAVSAKDGLQSMVNMYKSKEKNYVKELDELRISNAKLSKELKKAQEEPAGSTPAEVEAAVAAERRSRDRMHGLCSRPSPHS